MRKHFLRVAIVSGFLVVAAMLAANLFPDQMYASLEWGREWTRILTTRDSYGFLASKGPVLRFDGASSAAPFMLRKSSVPAMPYVDAEGYKVFQAWLAAVRLGNVARVHRESAALLLLEPASRCFPLETRTAYAEALADFAANNAQNWRFDLGLIGNGRVVGAVEERRPFRSEISFSAVGFGRERTVAVLYASYWCGGRCGRATFYVLDKRNGQWGNVRAIGRCGWIS